ncbi:hypothetical protein ACFFRR_003470 [Megaselia abdita]
MEVRDDADLKMEIEDELEIFLIKQQDIEMVVKEEPTLEISDDDFDSESNSSSESETSYDTVLEPDIKYECSKCEEIFKTLEGVNEHSKNVHSEYLEDVKSAENPKPLLVRKEWKPIVGMCKLCNYLSARNDYFLKHFKNLHPGQEIDIEWKCKNCPKFFKTIEQVIDHSNIEHLPAVEVKKSDSTFKERCPEFFRALEEAQKNQPPVLQYRCPKPPNQFTPLENHFTIKRKPVLGKCNLCHFSSNIQGNLFIHFEKDHPGRELNLAWKCKHCPNFFKTFKEVKVHSAIEHSEPLILEKEGKRNYASRQNSKLVRHFNRKHPGEEINVEWKCKYCQIFFKTLDKVRVHSIIEHYNILILEDEKFSDIQYYVRCCLCSYHTNRKRNLLTNFETTGNVEFKRKSRPNLVQTLGDSKNVASKPTAINPKTLMDFFITENFYVPPSHKIEDGILKHMNRLPIKKKDDLKSLGVTFTGQISIDDKLIIVQNFERFCDEYGITDHRPFLEVSKCRMLKAEKIKFARYLGQGLPKLALFCIYNNFKNMFNLHCVNLDLPQIFKKLKYVLSNKASLKRMPKTHQSENSVEESTTTISKSSNQTSQSPLPVIFNEYIYEIPSFSETCPYNELIIKYECTKCDEFFRNLEDLSQHSKKVHVESLEDPKITEIEKEGKHEQTLVTVINPNALTEFVIKENFEVHQSHRVEDGIFQHMTRLPLKKRNQFKSLGVTLALHISIDDKSIIVENFTRFCDEYGIKDHRPFLEVSKCGMLKAEQVKFARYLGQGLPTLALFCIYKNFQNLFCMKKFKGDVKSIYDLQCILKMAKRFLSCSTLDPRFES